MVLLSVAKLYLTLCNAMNCSMPGFPVLHSLPEFAQNHVHWVSDAIEPSYPLLPLLLLPSIFPSIRIFSSGSALCIKWSKYWSFSFSISSKALILQHSAFFMVQLSHPYMTAGKTIALTIQTFVGKSVFYFHGCSHRPRWFWRPRREICHCFHFFPHLFSMKWWDWMLWSLFFES